MPEKKRALGSESNVDARTMQPNEYDHAPELSQEWLDKAGYYIGDKLIRRGRGRPKSDAPKQQVTLRLDQDVIAGMRASGPGWQTRVNEALRRWVQRQRKAS
jgi:uncharacterized protein (DUF4415 family)